MSIAGDIRAAQRKLYLLKWGSYSHALEVSSSHVPHSAKLGAHKVIIRTEIPGEDGQPPIAKEKLPKKYHEQTELTAEVKPGANTFNFELTSQAGGAKK